MRLISLILILSLLFIPAISQTPTGYQKWSLGDNLHRMQFGGTIVNYQTGESWSAIDNTLMFDGDSVVFCNTAALKTRINKQGLSTVTLSHDGIDYAVTQQLLGVGWINTSTHGSLWIDSTMTWGMPSVGNNTIGWLGVSPGIDYLITKQNGQVQHRITFGPNFLDSAVVLYNQRPDSLDIALANVMVYTISSTCDDYDVDLGDIPKRALKRIGALAYQISGQRVSFPGSDTLAPVLVRQYWERRGSKIICLEYVKMRAIKRIHEAYPDSKISHNATFDITEADPADIACSYITSFSSSAQNNYGGRIWIESGSNFTGRFQRSFVKFNTLIDSMRVVGAATWNSALLKIVFQNVSGLGPGVVPGTDDDSLYISINKMTTLWDEGAATSAPEGGITWDSASATGTGGLEPNSPLDWTSDGGDFNATSEGDSVILVGGVIIIRDTLTFDILGTSIADTITNYGYAIYPAVIYEGDDAGASAVVSFYSDDEGTAARRPRLIVDYTAGVGEANLSYVRRIKEGEGK